MTDIKAIIDLDFVKYSSASVGEKRSIIVTHKSSGREKEFSTRTEFWGRDRAHTGGWLAELNQNRTSPFSVDEFEITDIQTPQPIEHVLQMAKVQVEGALKALKTKKYKAFVGKGGSFRVELSTLLKYKGQRENFIKPLHIDAVTEYLIKKFDAEIVTGIEADDACIMEAYGDKNAVVCGIDKDHYSSPVRFYNVNRKNEGIIDCDTFGKLYLDDDKKIRGFGRLHLYLQIASEDTTDNYKANCFSDKRWAAKSAYKALVGCKTDQEAWQVLKDVFTTLYPEEKTVIGWRGDEIDITWHYVLNECFQMARMLRFEGDNVSAYDVMDKMGVTYQ